MLMIRMYESNRPGIQIRIFEIISIRSGIPSFPV